MQTSVRRESCFWSEITFWNNWTHTWPLISTYIKKMKTIYHNAQGSGPEMSNFVFKWSILTNLPKTQFPHL